MTISLTSDKNQIPISKNYVIKGKKKGN